MIRMACVIVAAALLSGCGTLNSAAFRRGPSASYMSFDAEAPVEQPVFRLSLDRRSFGPPLRRQPELRAIVVTAADRLRRHALRRRR